MDNTFWLAESYERFGRVAFLSKKYPRYNQCHDDIERLRNDEGIERFAAVIEEEVGKSRFKADAGKGEDKPHGLNCLQAS